MGCWYSRLNREEMVSRCKARKRYMKQFVKARQAFSAAHSMYMRSLRSTGSALLQFATAETTLHHLPQLSNPNPVPPPPPRPTSPVSWATTSTTSSSTIRPPPPPPPPSVPSSSTWDFWDPFMPTSGRSADEEEWEDTTTVSATATATATTMAPNVAGPPSVVTATATTTDSSELAVVVSTKSKDLVEIIQELDDYFMKAANAATPLSLLLEIPVSSLTPQTSAAGKDFGLGKSSGSLLWSWGSGSARWNAFGKLCEDPIGHNNVACMTADGNATHSSTVERLYAWEKKLYQEVKNAELLKIEHEKKAAILRNLEMKNADYIKTEKAKKEVEKLESQMVVALQAIETTSTEIIKLRESELHPQLLQIINGLMSMWRSMYEFHQVQTHIVQQLKYLSFIPSTESTSEIHRQSTLQLELEAQQWHLSFCNLMKAQRDYIQSLSGWLRLSLFQVGNMNPLNKTKQDSAIYPFCEEWQLAINNAPDKVASEGIKSFLSMIHAIVEQQVEEQKQKRRSESVFKELEKKVGELRSLESKHGSYSIPDAPGETNKDPVREKRAKVETLRVKAADEKAKYEKSISVTRSMTMNNLQMGLPHVFQAMTGFANVCKQAFESVHNQAKSSEDLHNVKRILP